MNKLDSFDSGSNYHFGDKLQEARPPRSVFDLSHLVTTTIDNCGALIPISLLEVLPGDSFDISVRSLLRVLPQVVPLYSRQRMYIHAFYSRMSDLWSGFNVFMTKGLSGNRVLKIPSVTNDTLIHSATVTAGSLLDYLGLPQGISRGSLIAQGVSALPLMMYKRIWRDYFCNRNFHLEDLSLFPDDDGAFRLKEDGSVASGSMALDEILYRNYPDDYFTSALPFPQRGNTPTLDLALKKDVPLQSISAGTPDGLINTVSLILDAGEEKGRLGAVYRGQGDNDDTALSFGVSHLSPTSVAEMELFKIGSHPKASGILGIRAGSPTGLGITLDQLRELAIAQTELEKMARTDGSYSEFGLAFFGIRPKNAQTFTPQYIGGTYQAINFSEVLQTSATTDQSALGQYAGHGIGGDSNGYIGHLEADDYGYVMVIASLMPDVYYSQGLDKKWTRLLQSEYYLPERARLGLQPILNKELYFSGTESDNKLFAYQSAYDDYRYIPSRITGKIADPTSLSFFPYTQSRKFNSLPTFSESFAEAKNVRKDYLFAPNEVAYTCQFSLDIRAVRALPYKAIPAQILN